MLQRIQKKQTIDFYNSNAEQYASETIDLDVSKNRDDFLKLIPEGCNIMDLGCGSGRDSRFFIEQGYSVTAIDASEEIAKIASQIIGKDVRLLDFRELDYTEVFDGIWACASLLHCKKSEMRSVIQSIANALKPNGVVYMSFKYGNDERVDERGRFFSDYTEPDLSRLIADIYQLNPLKITTELKPLRGGFQSWLNLIAKKA